MKERSEKQKKFMEKMGITEADIELLVEADLDEEAEEWEGEYDE